MERINVRLDPQLKGQLEAAALAEGVSPSEVVRAALREHLKSRTPRKSCLDVARELGIVGIYPDGPSDLSTNPVHMEGFGGD